MTHFGDPVVAVKPPQPTFSVRVGHQTYTATQQTGGWIELVAPSQKAQKLYVPLDLLVKVVKALAPESTVDAVLDLPLRTILRQVKG